MMGLRSRFCASATNLKAPNMLPWSVRATPFWPSALALSIMSGMLVAPSSKENWVWQCRCTKSGMRVRIVETVTFYFLQEGAQRTNKVTIFVHFYAMHEVDSVRIVFHEGDLFALNILLAFIMFGVALDLHLEDFRNIIRRPKAALVGMVSEYVLLPLLSLALVYFFRPPVSLALGMMLIATCPGGNVSNFMVHLARGNAALSVSLTSVSTLAAVLITPLSFAFWSTFVPGAEEVFREVAVNPWKMVKSITILILIPVSLGLSFKRHFPVWALRLKKPISRLSIALFLGFVVLALYKNLGKMYEHLHWVFWIVAIHNGLSLLMGYAFAKWNHLSESDARAVAIETGIQNTGLGLVLVFNFFGGLGGMAMILAWWGVWHLLSGFVLAWFWARVHAVA